MGSQGDDWHNLLAVNRLTAHQIAGYRAQHPSFRQDEQIASMFSNVEAKFRTAYSARSNARAFVDEYVSFQSASLSQARYLWARFDFFQMGLGFILYVATLMAMFVYATGFKSSDDSMTDFSAFVIGYIWKFGLGGIFVGLIMKAVAVVLHLSVLSSSLVVLPFCVGMASIIGYIKALYTIRRLLHPFIVPPVNWRSWTALAVFYNLAHLVLFLSNSYIVWEDKSIAFLLSSFGFVCLMASFQDFHSEDFVSLSFVDIHSSYKACVSFNALPRRADATL